MIRPKEPIIMYTFIQIADTLIRFANAFIICSRFVFNLLGM